ncbi:MAG: hypothetical protein IKN43_09180 [Selenomonadaceae bacterium]|nr:hypothetical protein [Selenomonadaceae bacterium]
MNLKVVFAVIFALLVGIGGTSAYFYFDKLDRSVNAPPIPPAKSEAPAPPENTKNPPAPPAVSKVDTKGALSEADLVLGGISYGASIEDVKKVHGEPYETERKHKWHGNSQPVVYEYHKLFDVYIIDNIVRAVKVDRANGLSTSKNIGVGASVNDVIKAYGEPNIREKDRMIYLTANNPSLGIEFEIEHGAVDEIRVGLIK